MWVHCHAVALTTALTPCWRGLAATEEPLKVVSGARVREGRNASDQTPTAQGVRKPPARPPHSDYG